MNPSSRWYYPLRWLVLILLGLAIYGQTFGFGFVYDDFGFIVNNSYITRFDRVHYIWNTFPQTRTIGFYSFALNYFFNQLHPQGYHIFNFAIHLLAVGLVWATAAVLFQIAGQGLSVNPLEQELPFIIAVFFLVHPCQTQAVSYISQRFESMATVFYLGTIYCYLCARISLSKPHKIILFSFSFVLAILGILTKEVAATIPLMILAVEFILLNRTPLISRNSSGRFYLLLTFLCVLFVFLFTVLVRTDMINTYFHFSAPSASYDGEIITGGKYVLTQARVFLTFIRLLLLPVHQNADYDYPLSTGLLRPPLTLAGFCVMGLVIFLIFKLRREWPLIAFGLAWILITFSINTAPRINVIFEHKLYLISFGFFLAEVCALSDFIKDRKILFGVLIILITVLSLASFKRNQVWKNELTLWGDVIVKSPHKARAFNSMGEALGKQGDLIQALSDFNRAIEINPDFSEAYNNRGNIYAKQGLVIQSISDFNKAIVLHPDYFEPYINRGLAYYNLGQFSKAVSDYTRAVEINPYYADAYNTRGNIYDQEGNFALALQDYNKTIELGNNNAEVYLYRGQIFARQSDYTDAVSDFYKAIEISPNYAQAYNYLGFAHFKQGLIPQALSDYDHAIDINPHFAQAYSNRAIIYEQLKEYDKAWRDVRKVGSLGIKIDPEFLKELKRVSGLAKT